jgi:transcriptional/translational regulatory protein YebC/TACO1
MVAGVVNTKGLRFAKSSCFLYNSLYVRTQQISKIKHKKAASDAKKSQVFTKISKLITSESKKCGGDVNSPGLATVIIMAKKENMPKTPSIELSKKERM